jgi:hypothetical protein
VGSTPAIAMATTKTNVRPDGAGATQIVRRSLYVRGPKGAFGAIVEGTTIIA